MKREIKGKKKRKIGKKGGSGKNIKGKKRYNGQTRREKKEEKEKRKLELTKHITKHANGKLLL